MNETRDGFRQPTFIDNPGSISSRKSSCGHLAGIGLENIRAGEGNRQIRMDRIWSHAVRPTGENQGWFSTAHVHR